MSVLFVKSNVLGAQFLLDFSLEALSSRIQSFVLDELTDPDLVVLIAGR